MEFVHYLSNVLHKIRQEWKEQGEQDLNRRYQLKKDLKKFFSRKPRYAKMLQETEAGTLQGGGKTPADLIRQLKGLVQSSRSRTVNEVSEQLGQTIGKIDRAKEELTRVIKSQSTPDQLISPEDVANQVEIVQLMNQSLAGIEGDQAEEAIQITATRNNLNLPSMLSLPPLDEDPEVQTKVSLYRELIQTSTQQAREINLEEGKSEEIKEEELGKIKERLDGYIEEASEQVDHLKKLHRFFVNKNKELQDKLTFPITEEEIQSASVQELKPMIQRMLGSPEMGEEGEESKDSDEVKKFRQELEKKNQLYESNQITKYELIDFLNAGVTRLRQVYQDETFNDPSQFTIPYPDDEPDLQISNGIMKVELGYNDRILAKIKNLVIGKKQEITTEELHTMYAPQGILELVEETEDEGEGEGEESKMGGGGQEEVNQLHDQVQQNIRTMGELIDRFLQEGAQLKGVIDEYNLLQHEYMNLMVYISLTLTNQLMVDSYTIFAFFSRGILQYYFKQVEEINKRIIDKNDLTPMTLFFRKNYRGIIRALMGIEEVTKKMSRDQQISIYSASGNLQVVLHLLNHFKGIIDYWSELSQARVSIYMRPNNFKDWYVGGVLNYDRVLGKNPPPGEQTRIAQMRRLIDQMTFVSEYDLFRHGTNLQSNGALDRLLIRDENCPEMNPTKSHLEFTEVFGVEFTQNEEISKYMAMGTMISKGKGILLLTYGYSGTGKTFTLFGSSKGDRHTGLLQATLRSIDNLQNVKVRFYEVYGRGIQYGDYFKIDSEYLNQNTDQAMDQYLFHYQTAYRDGRIKLQGGYSQENKTGRPEQKKDEATGLVYSDQEKSLIIPIEHRKLYVSDGVGQWGNTSAPGVGGGPMGINTLPIFKEIQTAQEEFRTLKKTVRLSWVKYRHQLQEILQTNPSFDLSSLVQEKDLDTLETTLNIYPSSIDKIDQLKTQVGIIRSHQNALDRKQDEIRRLQESLTTQRQQIMKQIVGSESSFTYLSREEANSAFAQLDQLIGELDENRKKQKRILRTFNNPESSRSILVIDCLITVEIEGQKVEVPLVMIDPPGREEIIPTYVNAFLSKLPARLVSAPLKKKPKADLLIGSERVTNPEEHQLGALLASAAINPLYLPIFSNATIMKSFNALSLEDRQMVMNTELLTPAQMFINEGRILKEPSDIERIGGTRVIKQSKDGKEKVYWKVIMANDPVVFITTKDNPPIRTKYQKFSEIAKIESSDATVSLVRKSGYKGPGWAENTASNDYYMRGLACVGIIKRLINLHRFDLLAKIIQDVMNAEYNVYMDQLIEEALPNDKTNTRTSNIALANSFVTLTDFNSAQREQYKAWNNKPSALLKLLVWSLIHDYQAPDHVVKMTLNRCFSTPGSGLETSSAESLSTEGPFDKNTKMGDADYNQLEGEIPNPQPLRQLFKEYFHFRDPLAPYEGVYINEMINGLIRLLLKDSRFGNKTDQYIERFIPQKIGSDLSEWHFQIRNSLRESFQLQGSVNISNNEEYQKSELTPDIDHQVTSVWHQRYNLDKPVSPSRVANLLDSRISEGKESSSEKPIMVLTDGAYREGPSPNQGQKLVYQMVNNLQNTKVHTQLDELKKNQVYASSNFFSQYTLLSDILQSHYLNPDLNLIKDFKMFYLITNDKIKCKYQAQLLQLSMPFITSMIDQKEDKMEPIGTDTPGAGVPSGSS